jgi:putative addiction module killer protein
LIPSAYSVSLWIQFDPALFDRTNQNIRALARLAARPARQIARRIDRAASGNLGDVKALDSGVSELRIDVGAGYRVYFIQRGEMIIVLLAGGDKSSQRRDIQRAYLLAR